MTQKKNILQIVYRHIMNRKGYLDNDYLFRNHNETLAHCINISKLSHFSGSKVTQLFYNPLKFQVLFPNPSFLE